MNKIPQSDPQNNSVTNTVDASTRLFRQVSLTVVDTAAVQQLIASVDNATLQQLILHLVARLDRAGQISVGRVVCRLAEGAR